MSTEEAQILVLKNDLEKADFIINFLYDALGPANDDIMNMAEEAWEGEK